MNKTLIAFFLLNQIAFAQSRIVIGSADIRTYLYSTPGEYSLLSSKKDTISTIRNGNGLAVFALKDTLIKGVLYQWAKVVYHGKEGYVLLNHIRFDENELAKLKRINSSEALRDEAQIVARSFLKKDSLMLAEETKKIMEARNFPLEKAKSDSIYMSELAKRILKAGFGILYSKFNNNEYSVDFTVLIANYTDVSIKYISFILEVNNPVHDRITLTTVKGVGPIYPNTTATFKFDNFLFTRVFGYGYIYKVKIEYANGTIKEFNRSQLRSITDFKQEYSSEP